MPELPEVEAIASRARLHALDSRIDAVRVLRGKYLENQIDLLTGRWIKEVYRRGKYVLFELMDESNVQAGWLVCHNAMSGYWDYLDDPWTFDYVEGKRSPRQSDVRVELELVKQHPGIRVRRTLRFHDSRLFGRLKLMEKLDKLIVGPEALRTDRLLPGSPVMDKQEFFSALRSSKKELKPALMEQSMMGGVGNIYATEACGWTNLRPDMPANKVGMTESDFLFETMQELLSHNIPEIKYGWLRFYRKKVCVECQKGIVRIEQEGRSTWFCPYCQS